MTISADLHSDFSRIENRIIACKGLSSETDQQLISMLNDQLCIAITGRLEQNIKSIFVGYASRHSDRRLNRSISKLCQQFQNPTPEKILDLVDLFDTDFAKILKTEWESELSVGNQIKQMVSIRINIAHQLTNNSSLTLNKIESFFQSYKKLINRLQAHFLP